MSVAQAERAALREAAQLPGSEKNMQKQRKTLERQLRGALMLVQTGALDPLRVKLLIQE